MTPLLSVLGRIARTEAGTWRSLWWGVRRYRDIPLGAVAVPYHDRFTVVLWALCCLGALELAVVHVLTAGMPVLRWALFAIGVYGLVWCLGFGLGLRQNPHLVIDDELVLRLGHLHTVRVPLGSLRSATRSVDPAHRRNLSVDGDRLALSFMGETNVELRFSPGAPVDAADRVHPVAQVAFFADDPRGAARLLAARGLSPEERTTSRP
jgi:hypothetical protein